MLIDLDVLEISEIFEFLDDQELLKERINEAKELIENEAEGDKWKLLRNLYKYISIVSYLISNDIIELVMQTQKQRISKYQVVLWICLW